MSGEVDFEVLEKEMRVAVPEYGQVYQLCAKKIEAVQKCYEKGGNQKNCAQREDDLADCSHQAMCPKQFSKFVSCADKYPNDIEKCRSDAMQLQGCIEEISQRLMKFAEEHHRR